jgi:hypothetical protein
VIYHDEPHVVPLTELEARMRPGNYSQTGFLGEKESLVEVLRHDAQELAELGLEASELSARLGQLLEAALISRQTVTRVGHHNVRIRRYKGFQICPFAPEPFENPCPGGGARLASIDWDISNNRRSSRLSGPGLLVHLVGVHGFFEGLESPYRVAPRALAELLDLGPFAPASG